MRWQVTNDTQLTFEALCQHLALAPARFAACLVEAYRRGHLMRLGISTVQALRGLQVGGH